MNCGSNKEAARPVTTEFGKSEGTLRTSGTFFSRVESWRGLAALMVASAHAWQIPWRDGAGQLRSFYLPAPDVDGALLAAITPYLQVLNNGGGAINAFFVMSGFVLALSLVRGPDDLGSSATKFVIARIFRIYPAIIVTIGIFLLVSWSTGLGPITSELYTLRHIVRNALLIDTSMNGVMWSLQVEMIAIIPIFLAFALYRAWSIFPVVLLFIVLVAASFLGSTMRMLGPDLTALYAFIGGMLAFFGGRQAIGFLPPRWTALTFAVAFVAMCLARLLLGFSSNWAAIVEALLAAIVVAYLAFGALGTFGRLFDHSVVRFYGRISYSFYLLHPLTLWFAALAPEILGALVLSGIPTALVAFGVSAVTILAITPLAWLIYRFVERPSIAVGRALTQRVRERTA